MTARILLLMGPETYRVQVFLAAAARAKILPVVGVEVELMLATERPGRYLRVPFDDVEAAVEKARKFAEDYPLDAVLALDDEAVTTAAAIGGALDLAHNPLSAARCTRDKSLLRAALKGAALNNPRFVTQSVHSLDFDEVQSEVGYPCVIKPLSLGGSRGVIRADSRQALLQAGERLAGILARADAQQRSLENADFERVLIEEYLPGDEVALEGVLHHGVLNTLAIFDKPDPLHGPYFEETLYVTPTRHSPQARTAIVQCVALAVQAIGLQEGPVHAEVRLRRDGEGEVRATLLEVAARTIGGLCSQTLRFAGASLEEVVMASLLETPPPPRSEEASGVLMLPTPRAGCFERLDGVTAALRISGVTSVEVTCHAGQELTPLPEGHRYLGFIFARAPTPGDVEKALREAQACLTICYRDQGEQGSSPERKVAIEKG